MPNVRFAVGIQRTIRECPVQAIIRCHEADPGKAFLGYHHLLMMLLAASWILTGLSLLTSLEE
jgi:hypothetical protein